MPVRLAAAAAMLLLAACATAPSTDEAVRFFNDVAFRGAPGGHPMAGRVLAQSRYSEHRLYRWEEEIRLTVTGPGGPARRQRVVELFARLAELTGRPYAILDSDPDRANFEVEFVSEDGFLINRTEFVPCYAHTEGGEGKIRSARIEISLERPELADYCIAHELMHGFGLAHSNLLPSVLNPTMRRRDPTRWDELVLATLYDSRLSAGKTRMTELPIARRIIAAALTAP